MSTFEACNVHAIMRDGKYVLQKHIINDEAKCTMYNVKIKPLPKRCQSKNEFIKIVFKNKFILQK